MATVTVKKAYKNFEVLGSITEDLTITNKSGYTLQVCVIDEVERGTAITKEIVSDEDKGIFEQQGGAGLILIGLGETKTITNQDLGDQFLIDHPHAEWALLNREDQLRETMEIEREETGS